MVEVLRDGVGKVVQTNLLAVQNVDVASAIALKERQCTLVGLAAAAHAHEQEHRLRLVEHLEGTVEELAAVDSGRVYLQHLLDIADRENVGRTVGGARTHDIDGLLARHLFGPTMRQGTRVCDGLAIHRIDDVEGRHRRLVLRITLELIDQRHRDLERNAGVYALNAGLVQRNGLVGDLLVADCRQVGLLDIQCDGRRAKLLCGPGRLAGLLGASHRADDRKSVLVNVGRRGQDELVARKCRREDRLRLALHEVVGRMEAAKRATCSNPDNMCDVTRLEYAPDNC